MTLRLDIVPDKGQYRPGDGVRLGVRASDGRSLRGWTYDVAVLELTRTAYEARGEWAADEGEEEKRIATITIPPLGDGAGAYGAFVVASGPEGETCRGETAFDYAAHWREAPRYGFLSDFAPEEAGRTDDVEFLNRHHINVVQFYDWMYRHDRLLPDTDEFVDPLGRRMSLSVVREKIAALRAKGIASMAYVAVYGSLPDYIEQHPEQGLYQNDGKPHSLGNFFHIMDITADSAWTAHMLDQYERAVVAMQFDGVHLDQYGFPKKAIRRRGGAADVVALKELYPRFIDSVRERMSTLGGDLGVVFNNVGNFPSHTTAAAQQDIMYSEIWDPASHLRDLKAIIDHGRQRSGKQMVLAAYLPWFHPEEGRDPLQAEYGATLAMAAIFASGGYHLLLGEGGGVLADPYFPKYGTASERFKETLTRYYDFIVMYRELLFDPALDDVSMAFTGGINTEVVFAAGDALFTPNERPDAVWTIVKEKPGFFVLHLINLLGVDNDLWKEGKEKAPDALVDIEVKVELWEDIEGVYWASPDGSGLQPERLEYEYVPKGEGVGHYIRFTLPRLNYWTVAWVQLREGVPAATYDPNAYPARE
jgi:dextranase